MTLPQSSQYVLIITFLMDAHTARTNIYRGKKKPKNITYRVTLQTVLGVHPCAGVHLTVKAYGENYSHKNIARSYLNPQNEKKKKFRDKKLSKKKIIITFAFFMHHFHVNYPNLTFALFPMIILLNRHQIFVGLSVARALVGAACFRGKGERDY